MSEAKNETISIEGINEESLAKMPLEGVQELLGYLTGIRTILQAKIALTHSVQEQREQEEALRKETANWSPEKKKAMAQILGGDHIQKEEKTGDGA